jgi:hypothetical protein
MRISLIASAVIMGCVLNMGTFGAARSQSFTPWHRYVPYGSQQYKSLNIHRRLNHPRVKACGGVCDFPEGLDCECPGGEDVCCGLEVCEPGHRDCGVRCIGQQSKSCQISQ